MTAAAHPNLMTAWPEIRCQRGHESHAERIVHVEVGGPTPYRDYTDVPERLARGWEMRVWERPDDPPALQGLYCPANDAVSETIAMLGIWEPRETAVALAVLDSAEDPLMADFGSQVGWFSLLALSSGASVVAVEADQDNAELLEASVRWTGNNPDWPARFSLRRERIGPASEPLSTEPIRLAKIDVEGAEDSAVQMLWPTIEAGLLDHLVIEVSPCFDGYYGAMMASLMDAGFEAFVLPPKRTPPVDLADPAAALAPYRLDRRDVEETVAGWTQEDVWLKRAGASW